MNKKGKICEVTYEKCISDKLKTKIRMLSNLLEKLSNLNHNMIEYEKSPKK